MTYNSQACSSEVMMLRVARRYDAASDSVLFANNQAYTRDNYRKAGMAYVIEDLLHFCRCMYSMALDNIHYALLTAVVIFSGKLNRIGKKIVHIYIPPPLGRFCVHVVLLFRVYHFEILTHANFEPKSTNVISNLNS